MSYFIRTEVVLTDGSKETAYYLTEEGKEKLYAAIRSEDFDRFYRELKSAIAVIRDDLHKQLISYLEDRIIGFLRRSKKAYRARDLREAILSDADAFFWMEFSEALGNLEKAGKIILNRGWIKEGKGESEESIRKQEAEE